ncbi:MAG: hypothetical protein COX39_00040 [Candidatus Nealsonbacteria bacterium CG23_combo_of_CG06-09_8_20_14_all_40_13]|uniref:YARHG domain-containing protein n=1 Tax=Candidatus Nealsonbacteria bacterium CG23_combo_of_CG06-09_8_20_14_all_40_13 TaxID=1974724 RepID=A0A2G9YRU1_9BACT|nr:MAG: hypothetical protein COX39_00040 [Candidatus Nealsonbacteria bacterium CG23_combo_of_CG06-09_8_20_14_all_40_13]PIR71247.1 MAG: hypothetical protein COU44_00590 [Candidatus Nealsonbacteria bacterium CG10_big_fil_rev_8_21_14_0_10_40_24]
MKEKTGSLVWPITLIAIVLIIAGVVGWGIRYSKQPKPQLQVMAVPYQNPQVIYVPQPAQPEPPRVVYVPQGNFVFPDSSYRRLNSNDLLGKTDWELAIGRNEIYARHGRPFVKQYFRDYFRSQSWYSEDTSFTENRLNSVESRNTVFILQEEKRRGSQYSG